MPIIECDPSSLKVMTWPAGSISDPARVITTAELPAYLDECNVQAAASPPAAGLDFAALGRRALVAHQARYGALASLVLLESIWAYDLQSSKPVMPPDSMC